MSFEVASGHVSIFPKFASGFGKQIKGELSGAGSEAAKSTGSAFGSHLKAILASQVITKAVSGISGVFTSALKGGLSRLMGVEEAQAKMRGLGHSAEAAAAVVQQAQKAVDGTIYTTAEASTVAASALAAGIKPGEELDKVLASVANAASTAGVGMDEMGSIYNKVASVGKAQNDSLQQVADRGIPIYQALAEQLGVTTEEVFDMASAGKIGFKEFEEAMTAASGTVAQEMGNTLSGALANTRSALSKIGENLLSGVFPALTPLMLGLREGLKGLQEPALAAGEALGNWLAPKMEALGGHLANLPSIIGDFGSRLSGVFGPAKDAVKGFIDTFREAGGGFDGILAALSQAVTEAVDWLTSGGITMIADGLLAGRQRLLDAALELFPAIIEAAVQIIPQVVSFMSESLLPSIIGVLVSSLPLLVDGAIQLFNGLIEGLVQVVPVLVQALTDALPVVLEALLSLLPALIEAAVELFSALVDGLLIALPLVLDALIQALPQILDTVLSLLPQLLEAAITLFLALATGVVEALPEIITALLDILPSLVSTIIGMIPTLIEAAFTLFIALVTGLLKALPQLIGAITGQVIPQTLSALASAVSGILAKGREWINGLSDGVTRAWPAVRAWFADIGNKVTAAVGAAVAFLVQKGKDILTGLQNGINDGWRGVKDWFGGLGSKVIGALGNLSGLLVGSGKSLMSGLASGIKQGFSSAVGAVKDGLSNLRSYFPFSPAKLGPFSGSGYTTFSGRALARDFGDAIAGEADYLQRRAADLMRAAQLEGQVNVSASGLPGANSGRSVTQHITLQVPRDAFADVNTFMQFIAHLQRHAAAV